MKPVVYDEEEAEEALIKYEDIIRRLSYIFKVEGYDHDDLEQEFRMVLLGCMSKFDKSRDVTFNTYLTRSCENRVKRLRRKQEFTVSLNADAGVTIEFIDLLESKTMDPEEFSKHDESVKLVMDVLDNRKYGEVTKMYLMYGLSQIEIAEYMGMSKSYINKIHNKNLEAVRKQLGKRY